jgi:hypothetical protein
MCVCACLLSRLLLQLHSVLLLSLQARLLFSDSDGDSDSNVDGDDDKDSDGNGDDDHIDDDGIFPPLFSLSMLPSQNKRSRPEGPGKHVG